MTPYILELLRELVARPCEAFLVLDSQRLPSRYVQASYKPGYDLLIESVSNAYLPNAPERLIAEEERILAALGWPEAEEGQNYAFSYRAPDLPEVARLLAETLRQVHHVGGPGDIAITFEDA